MPRIVASALDREAVALGAVRIAPDTADERYFTSGMAGPPPQGHAAAGLK
ncbi:hypothetical protein [Streptomyces sp. NPDC056390]